MKRREFVTRALGALGVAPLAAACASAPAQPAARRRRAVVQLATWAGDLDRDLDGTLALAHRLGVRLVEWPAWYATFGRSARDVRAALDRAGLVVESVSMGTGPLYRGLDRALDAMRTLGAARATVISPSLEERRTPADWPELLDAYAAAAERAREAGLALSVRVDAWTLERLLATPAPPVDVTLQMGVARATSDPVATIRRLGSRLAAVQVRIDTEGDVALAERAAPMPWLVAPGTDLLLLGGALRIIDSESSPPR